MPTFFQRPENALKRANEFIDVGKKQRALDALYDVIKSKKHRTWQKIHEPIMEKYLELCVVLKKSHVAKEGLYQYKNICQQVNVKSLEDVVRKYLAMAEEKTEAARVEAHQVVVDIDDLDIIQTPESLLLSAVSGEDTQDRTDRAILTPWVKFLWESYRQCLDLLRNNSSVEKLYQDIAQQAFRFCLKYTRKTEFRKLCDNLRTHLGHIHKHQHQQRAINLNNPESQAMHLETRLAQLDSAIHMELWQEAFKAVEDIHGLIVLSKKSPKPSLMANYYQKLGLVFWKSGNHMFHASAWHRLFHLSREQRKNLTQDELLRMASNVVCATLAIPIPPSRNQVDQVLGLDENYMEKQRRLATLLGLSSPPTRAGLVKDLVKYNVIQFVHPEMQNLYRWLEVEFHPLTLSNRVESSLEFIRQKEELTQYVQALQDISITRLLKQVSQVYQTIEFSRLAALAPFASEFRLERVVVNAAKNLDLQVRIDHQTRSLSFGTHLGVSQKEDVPEGPYLQSMPSEQIRNQLTHMTEALEKALAIIQPKSMQTLTLKRDELRAHIIQSYRQTAKKEHQRILTRRQIIEERKEELENINTQREQEELQQQEEQRRKQYEAEMLRLEREAEERERQRRNEERKEIQRKAAKEKLEQLRSTAIGAKVFADIDVDVMAELDADEIMAKQVEQLEKEKREMMEKLRQQEKKVDYFVRAKRLEEIPLLEKQYEEEKVQAQEFWEQQETQRIGQMQEDREQALIHRERMSRMTIDKDSFLSKLKEARMSVYKDNLSDFDKKMNEEKKHRLAERKEKRREERRQKWLQEKEEEEQRKKDEELIRIREEEERVIQEKQEKEEEEYQEKMRKLEEMAEKQRQREREIEERESKRREEQQREERDKKRVDNAPSDWRRDTDRDRNYDRPRDTDAAWKPLVRAGGWREREKEREDSWRRPTESRDAPRALGRDEDRDRGPPGEGRDRGLRDEGRGGGWRDRAPPRDDRDQDRDEGRGWRDRTGRDRDEGRGGGGGGGWRDRGPMRDEPGRDERPSAWRDRGPPDRDRDDRAGDRGAWRDRPTRDDRGGDSWRDRAAPARDSTDRGPWRRDREAEKPPPRDDWRDKKPPMEDRAPPPSRDREESSGSSWRDREAEQGRNVWSDRERARVEKPPPAEERSAWRTDKDKPPVAKEEPVRKSTPSPAKSSEEPQPPPEKPPAASDAPPAVEIDGWTTVRR